MTAQVVGVADVFDALTSARSYRGAMSHDEAMRVMAEIRHQWSAKVYAAFVSAAAALEVSEVAAVS